MHFHLPKPLHGWRAFVGEVGIIVLGVLIALGAEQAVESIHERYLARDAKNHIRSELAYDSAFAAERVAIGGCMRASLADLRHRLLLAGENWPGLDKIALVGAANTATTAALFSTNPPLRSPHRLWPVSAWAAATTSGVLNRDGEHFFNYAALYAMVDWLSRLQDHEIADYANVMPFNVPQKLDPSARLQLLRDLGTADADNAEVERLAAVFVTAARRNGIPPDPMWLERVLRFDTEQRGACVKHGPALDRALASEFNVGSKL